jgi:hypothetical protein
MADNWIFFGDGTTLVPIPESWGIERYEDGKTVVFPLDQDTAFLWLSTVSFTLKNDFDSTPAEYLLNQESSKEDRKIAKCKDRVIVSHIGDSVREGCRFVSHHYTVAPYHMYHDFAYIAFLTLSIKEPELSLDFIQDVIEAAEKIAESIIFGRLTYLFESDRCQSPIFLDLPSSENERLKRQRSVVLSAAKKYYDISNFSCQKEDLKILQRLLDEKVFKNKTYELQSMGIVFGDVLANELGLHWTMVVDEYGIDPVLRHKETTLRSNPIHMISKRVERGEEVDVMELFEKLKVHNEELKGDGNLV